MIQQIIQQLVNLQYIDNQILQLYLLTGNLPIEVGDIEDDIQRIKVNIKREFDKMKEAGKNENKLELAIANAQERLAKYEKQQLEVRNNREYNAITKEIEIQQDIIIRSKEELDIIELHKEEYDNHKEIQEKKLDNLKENYGKKNKELKLLVDASSKKKEYLIGIRNQVAKEVEPRYLKIYERLQKGYVDKMAVVPMEKGASMGISLPPQRQVEVRHKNKFIIDEHSGRIVVDPSFFENAIKHFNKTY